MALEHASTAVSNERLFAKLMAAILTDPATIPSDTKERLLEVGERLFAEHGFDNVSLRTITANAEANLAAVNYHFGSKEALIEEVVARRLEPVNRQRVERLRSAQLEGLTVERVVAAFLDPVFEEALTDGVGNRFCKLMSRCIAARDERVSEMVIRQFPEVVTHFVAAIRECVPSLSSDEAHLRLLFMAGAMAHSLFHYDKMEIASAGRCKVPSLDSLRAEIGAFLARGLQAQCQAGGVGR